MTAYDELLDLARDVALEAARLVAERQRSTVAVAATKTSPTDVVTEADRASEDLIRKRLLAARPEDGFVGEEGGSTSQATSASGVTWVVDPIDGTVNFLYGIPTYAVSIAAQVGVEVVAGVVVDVVSGECFTATRGGGAFADGRPIRVREVAPPTEQLVLTGFSYERETRRRQGEAVARLLPEIRDVRRLGSAALDLCHLGAGRADAYVEEGLNEWDLAAGGLVAEEAGARVALRAGVGGKRCVIAAPAAALEEFLALAERTGFFRE